MPYVGVAITLDGVPVYEPDSYRQFLVSEGIETNRASRANSFVLPRGKDYGRGWVLMTYGDYLTVNPNGGFIHTLRFEWGDRAVDIEGLIIHRVEALTAVDEVTPDTLYLLHLADQRILGELTDISNAYNVYRHGYTSPVPGTSYSGDFLEISTDGGTPWTWETLLDDLALSLPFTVTIEDPSLLPGSGSPPTNVRFHGVSAWDAYCRVLEQLNHEVVPVHTAITGDVWAFDNEFKVIPLFSDTAFTELQTDATTALPFFRHVSYDEQNSQSFLPEKVRVHFPKKDFAFQNSADPFHVEPKLYQSEEPLYTIEVNTADVDGVSGFTTIPGTTKGIHVSLIARYDDQGDLENEPELLAAAEEFAERWLQSTYFSDRYLHNIYDGLHSFKPGPEVAAVAWHDTGSGVHTEVVIHPRQFDPLGSPGSFARPFRDLQDLHAQEAPSSPDLARHHMESGYFTVVQNLDAATETDPATAEVLYGTNAGPDIIWDPVPDREMEIYEAGGPLAFFHHQTRRWIRQSTSTGGADALATLTEIMCPVTAEEENEEPRSYGVNCVVLGNVCGVDKPTTACNPLQLAGEAGDVVYLRLFQFCDGETQSGDSSSCPDFLCDPESQEGAEFRWVIIQVEHKAVCAVADLEKRTQSGAECLVEGKLSFVTMLCSRQVCGEVVTELEPVENPIGCDEVNTAFEFDAATGCPTTMCCGLCQAQNLTATVTAVNCPCLAGPLTIPMFWSQVEGCWTGSAATGCGDAHLRLCCQGDPTNPSWLAVFIEWGVCASGLGDGNASEPFAPTGTCDPFMLVGQATLHGINCCGVIGGDAVVSVVFTKTP